MTGKHSAGSEFWPFRIRRTVASAIAAAVLTTMLVAVPRPQAAQAFPANGTPNEVIANLAMNYVNQWGGNACIAAGRSGYNGSTPGGQLHDGLCKAFIVCIVLMATGMWVGNDDEQYQTGFPREGAIEVRPDEAQRGDIVMIGATDQSFPLHAAIIWAPVSGQRFQVIDSNFSPDEKVRFGTLLIPTRESHIWRLGQVPSGRNPEVNGTRGSILGSIGPGSVMPAPGSPINPIPFPATSTGGGGSGIITLNPTTTKASVPPTQATTTQPTTVASTQPPVVLTEPTSATTKATTPTSPTQATTATTQGTSPQPTQGTQPTQATQATIASTTTKSPSSSDPTPTSAATSTTRAAASASGSSATTTTRSTGSSATSTTTRAGSNGGTTTAGSSTSTGGSVGSSGTSASSTGGSGATPLAGGSLTTDTAAPASASEGTPTGASSAGAGSAGKTAVVKGETITKSSAPTGVAKSTLLPVLVNIGRLKYEAFDFKKCKSGVILKRKGSTQKLCATTAQAKAIRKVQAKLPPG